MAKNKKEQLKQKLLLGTITQKEYEAELAEHAKTPIIKRTIVTRVDANAIVNIQELSKNGHNKNEISEKTGFSVKQISNVLKKYGQTTKSEIIAEVIVSENSNSGNMQLAKAIENVTGMRPEKVKELGKALEQYTITHAENLETNFIQFVLNAMRLASEWVQPGQPPIFAKEAVDMAAKIFPMAKTMMRMKQFTDISQDSEEALKQQKLKNGGKDAVGSTEFNIYFGEGSKAVIAFKNSDDN